MPVVKAPTGLSLFPHEVFVMPKSWDERYYNLKSLNHLPTGGHFTAMEEPELLCSEIATFFTSVRAAG